MHSVLCGSFAPSRWSLTPPSTIRVVDWNIDRGLQLGSINQFLWDQRADILILQEVDLNARRTGFRNIAEEIARKLRMNYTFGYEFQELTQGRPGKPAYHGQATLSLWPLKNARIIRFVRQSDFWRPRWYLPHWQVFQERLGGRIALATEVNVGERMVVTYNLHLESRGDDQLRHAQFGEVLSDAERYAPKLPVIIAGDLNFDASQEPVSAEMERLQFVRAQYGSRVTTTPPRSFFERGRTIDWLFTRGPVRALQSLVHNNVRASDHYPVSLTLGLQ